MTKTCMKCTRTATLRLENNGGWVWMFCTQHAKSTLLAGRIHVQYASPAPGFVLYPSTAKSLGPNGTPALPEAAREVVMRFQR